MHLRLPSAAMAPIAIDTYGQLAPYNQTEWLLTNGLGGYAFSTIIGCNTRRYHGLLIAANKPPVGRVSVLSRVGEMMILDGDDANRHELPVNQFRDNVHPHGERYLQQFELEEVARWHYVVDGVRVMKELLVPWKTNAVAVRYTVEADRPDQKVELRLFPFFALRDFHALRRAAGYDMPTNVVGPASIIVSSDDLKAHLDADCGEFVKEPAWWYGHVYPVETDRGQDDSEDLFCPGRFTHSFTGEATITLVAALEPGVRVDWDAEVARRRKALTVREQSSSAVTRLTRAANDFIVARNTPDGRPGSTVIAGYPWFADWGRDTMIALPGLFLVPGRFDEAKQVLTVFASYVSEGMIPNRFDDYTNEPHYNTVDASLWFIHACFEYARLSKDHQTFETTLRPACRAIIDGYRRGTRFKIRMDEADGLITQGDEQTQLTWMDAKCNGVAFTPRQGKPVEINALWYHALVLMGEKQLAEKVRASFQKAFWISPFRGLADVVNEGQKDNSIRPNQIFAASLPNSPLTAEQQSAVVEVVRRELLTPCGLRTLAKSDPKFKSRYSGPQFFRDQTYHNGMVWPWLIGAFLDAYLRVHDDSDDAQSQARRWLSPLIDHLDEGCLNSISEIFEADEPYRAVGCCAQAWSVAEVLRLAVRLGM